MQVFAIIYKPLQLCTPASLTHSKAAICKHDQMHQWQTHAHMQYNASVAATNMNDTKLIVMQMRIQCLKRFSTLGRLLAHPSQQHPPRRGRTLSPAGWASWQPTHLTSLIPEDIPQINQQPTCIGGNKSKTSGSRWPQTRVSSCWQGPIRFSCHLSSPDCSDTLCPGRR